MSSQQAADLSEQSGWSDTNVYGSASVLLFRRRSPVPLIAQIRINPEAINKQLSVWGSRNQDFHREHFWKKTFHHELGHAFGIGTSPAWTSNLKSYGNCDVFFQGENALREAVILQAMDASNHPFDRYDSRGVRLSCQWGNPGGHWSIPVWGIFKTYYLQENGAPNISAIDLGAFEDVGFKVNYTLAGAKVGLSMGLLCGQTNRAHLFTGDDLFKICK